MKPKLLLSALLSFSFYLLSSQVPLGFNYQAIARDGSGNPIVGATIKVKLSILTDTAGFRAGTGGTYLWEEEHLDILTNAYGLFNIVLGDPLAIKTDGSAASFSVINWSLADLYVGTKIANPTTYKVLGATKMWSVPYSLLAKETQTKQSLSLAGLALSITGGNTVTLPSGSNFWQQNGPDIYYAAGKVGIWTGTPLTALTVTENTMTGITYPLYIQNASGDWTAAEKGVGLKFGRLNPTSGHDYGTIRGTIANASGGAGRLQFIGGGGSVSHMTIDYMGNVGIGTDNPTEKLELQGTNSKFYFNSGTSNMLLFNTHGVAPPSFSTRSVGTKMVFFPNLSSTASDYAIGIESGTLWYSVPGANSTFAHKFYGGNTELMRIRGDGNVGIGTASTTSKVVIQPPATWDDNTPLFEVRNKYGTPVLAVYNNGVRILVGHDPVKGITKGGFAIGGFDNTKAVGETVNLMTVNPDSVRFNIDNGDTKGITKGGFAIGSFDQAKAIIINPKGFMNLTPSSSANGQYNTFVGYQTGFKNSIGLSNTFLGYQAGLSNTSGDNNIYLGYRAGYNSQLADTNIFIGYEAGFNTRPGAVNIGHSNVYLGNKSGWSNVSGMRNVCIGHEAGYKNTSNLFTAVGYKAGYSSTTAIMQAFFGTQSGYKTTGAYNAFFGYTSGFNNTTGADNTYIGTSAGSNGTIGGYNTVVGSSAGGGAGGGSFGSRNVFVGYTAGYGQTGCAIGDDNVFIGYSTGRKSSNSVGSRNIFIGANTGSSETGNDRLYIDNINTTTPLIFGEFDNNVIRINGSFYVTGSAYKPGGGSWLATSDERMKDIHGSFKRGLKEILNLNPVYFSYKNGNSRNLPSENEYIGFVAQSVRDYLPEAVTSGNDGYLDLDMHVINVALVNAVKEQEAKIEIQQQQIDKLQKIVEEMQAMMAKGEGK